MGIIIKDFNTITDDVLESIKDRNIGITNIAPGSVIRTIVEAIASEIDICYDKISSAYNAMTIDNAYGEELDALVSVFSIVRVPATKSVGTVRLSRATSPSSDIPIPVGTVLSTVKDNNGNIYEVIITDTDKVLSVGNTYVDVNVECVDAGNIFIPTGRVTVINTPIIGISSASNTTNITGGDDAEDDESLRLRAKSIFNTYGKGTVPAIEYNIGMLPYVLDVNIEDMKRGVSTADVTVITNAIPMTSEQRDQISEIIANTKPAGVDIDLLDCTVQDMDLDIDVSHPDSEIAGDYSDTIDAILKYFDLLTLGKPYIATQLQKNVSMLYDDDDSYSIVINAPSQSIVTCPGTSVIRPSSITINGILLYGG